MNVLQICSVWTFCNFTDVFMKTFPHVDKKCNCQTYLVLKISIKLRISRRQGCIFIVSAIISISNKILTKLIIEIWKSRKIMRQGKKHKKLGWPNRIYTNSQVSQTYLEDKINTKSKIITQSVNYKHPSQFTDKLPGSTSTYCKYGGSFSVKW